MFTPHHSLAQLARHQEVAQREQSRAEQPDSRQHGCSQGPIAGRKNAQHRLIALYEWLHAAEGQRSTLEKGAVVPPPSSLFGAPSPLQLTVTSSQAV